MIPLSHFQTDAQWVQVSFEGVININLYQYRILQTIQMNLVSGQIEQFWAVLKLPSQSYDGNVFLHGTYLILGNSTILQMCMISVLHDVKSIV